MIEDLIYIISFISAVIGIMLYPKTSKKVNAICNGMFAYVTVMCFGSVAAFIINTIGFSIRLSTMGSSFLLIAIFTLSMCAKQHTIQKMYLRKCDIESVIILSIIVGSITIYIFTPSIRPNYYNPIDPINHYNMAMQVVRGEAIKDMYFAPLYNGMIINLFKCILPTSWLYKAFIIGDAFHVLIQLLFFYAIVVILLNGNGKKFLPLFICVIYWIGFPLFSYAEGGYVYWSMAAMLVEYVVVLLKWYSDNNVSRKLVTILIMAGCFGVTVCYIQLAPGLLLTVVGVYLYHAYLKANRQFDRKVVILGIVASTLLVLCACIGYYLVFWKQGRTIFRVFKLGSQENTALEILIMCPFIMHCIFKEYKQEQKVNAIHATYIVYLGIQFIMTVFSLVGLISTYYLFKTNIVFWFLTFAVLLGKKVEEDNGEKRKKNIYILGIICFLTLSYNGVRDDMLSLNNSIYGRNLKLFVNADFSNGYLSDMGKINLGRYAMEEMTYVTTPIPMVFSSERKGAGSFYCATYEGARSINVNISCSKEELEKKLNEMGAEYFIVFFDDSYYRENADAYLNDYERYYVNDDGFIAKIRNS